METGDDGVAVPSGPRPSDWGGAAGGRWGATGLVPMTDGVSGSCLAPFLAQHRAEMPKETAPEPPTLGTPQPYSMLLGVISQMLVGHPSGSFLSLLSLLSLEANSSSS